MSIGNPISLTNNVAAKTISATATPGQTLFTVTGGYRINQLSVYRNGTRLVDSQDYTARDGATVTLLSPASGSDVIEFQIFDDFRVADALDVNSGGTVNGNVTVNGTLSATSFSGNITGTAATFTGNVTIGGTLTYEDVTNIDSVGLITARSGVIVNTGTATTALIVNGDARVTGILTVGTSSITLDGTNNEVNVGTGVTIHHTNGVQVGPNTLHSTGLTVNNLNATGIVTASSFVDDGTDLLSEINTKATTGKAIAMSMIFG